MQWKYCNNNNTIIIIINIGTPYANKQNVNNDLSTKRGRLLTFQHVQVFSPPQFCLKIKIQIFLNKYRLKRSVPSFVQRRSSLINHREMSQVETWIVLKFIYS